MCVSSESAGCKAGEDTNYPGPKHYESPDKLKNNLEFGNKDAL